MATVTAKLGPGIARWSWTVFVLIGVFMLLIGWADFSSSGSDQTLKEAGIDELFLGALAIVGAVGGLRRGERWAWILMAIWPLWVAAELARVLAIGKTAEAIISAVFLALMAGSLALSFPRSFRRLGREAGL